MIKKILKISGVGKFKNFSSNHDDLTFKKNTVIFGFNTYGKSTLTTIFRSLKISDQGYIEGKRTFGHTKSIAIDILDDSNKHITLANGSWKNENISIFDNQFVHNSVFIGDEIDHKHKSNLYGIFIGDEINQKVLKLKSLREEQFELEKERDKVKLGYKKSDLGTFESFLKLKDLETLEQNIQEKKKEIEILKNISELKRLTKSTSLKSDFLLFSKSLQKKLDESANDNIDLHVKNHWKDPNESKTFLAEGVNLLKEDTNTCVFCGQDISPVQGLIENFKKVFNKSYDDLRKEIVQAGESFIRIDIDAELSKFIPYGVTFENDINKKLLLDSKTNLDSEVKIKIANFNYEIDFLSEKCDFQVFTTEINKLHSAFKKIEENEFSLEKLKVLNNELNTLLLIEYRFSEEGKDLYKSYNDSLVAIEKRKEEIKILRAKIDQETEQIINKNQTLINATLKTLGADFTIEKLSSKSNLSRSDSHFIDYEFFVHGQPVPISNKASQSDIEPKDKYYFGNTLSDSDRRLLAMSFFISSLKNDGNLKDKIVVLDDPFSSFDSNRKDDLANVIIDISNDNNEKPKQLIVLTHDDSFLVRLQNKLPTEDTRLLKIQYSEANGSVLDICNIDDIIEEDYFKCIKEIKKAVDNSVGVDSALKNVRICLERLLKHKYYFLLDSETIASGNITKYLEKIGDKCVVKDKIMSDHWHEHMHDQHQIMKMQEPQKIKKLKDFLELMEQI